MSKIYTREQMLEAIKGKYPKQHIRTSEEFSEVYENGLWMSAEDGTTDTRGNLIFRYYVDRKAYSNGVINQLNNFVKKHGWFFEWYDAGTIMLYPL